MPVLPSTAADAGVPAFSVEDAVAGLPCDSSGSAAAAVPAPTTATVAASGDRRDGGGQQPSAAGSGRGRYGWVTWLSCLGSERMGCQEKAVELGDRR